MMPVQAQPSGIEPSSSERLTTTGDLGLFDGGGGAGLRVGRSDKGAILGGSGAQRAL